MRILITGITGFAGGHLAEALLSRADADIVGLGRQGRWPVGLQHLADRVALHACDLCDRAATEALLRSLRPDQIYHLAGYAHTGRPFVDADVVWASNLAATRRLY